jgi:hypothetical protein
MCIEKVDAPRIASISFKEKEPNSEGRLLLRGGQLARPTVMLGRDFTGFITESLELYTCGNGRKYQLCNSTDATVKVLSSGKENL